MAKIVAEENYNKFMKHKCLNQQQKQFLAAAATAAQVAYQSHATKTTRTTTTVTTTPLLATA